MILASLQNRGEYYGIHPNLDRVLDLLTPEYLENVSTEKTSIDGEDIFVTRFDLETVPLEQTFFEAHRQYLDLHAVIRGRERVDIAHPDTLTLDQHSGDFYGYHGQAQQRVLLEPGNFLVVFPGDAHRLKIAVDHPGEPFTRVVFKIKVYE